MRRLYRGGAPACLARYRHGAQNWGAIDDAARAEIWLGLDGMQGHRCAYCECGIGSQDSHIEHFRQRGRFPQGTFDWDNLFGSCNREETCGKHKDRCGVYNPADLIKPDVEDPDHFFIFSGSGAISVRQGLSANDQHRAVETLRIFNLDAKSGALRYMRYQAAVGYMQTAEQIQDIAKDDPENEMGWREWLEEEVGNTSTFPFATAIRHALLGN